MTIKTTCDLSIQIFPDLVLALFGTCETCKQKQKLFGDVLCRTFGEEGIVYILKGPGSCNDFMWPHVQRGPEHHIDIWSSTSIFFCPIDHLTLLSVLCSVMMFDLLSGWPLGFLGSRWSSVRYKGPRSYSYLMWPCVHAILLWL